MELQLQLLGDRLAAGGGDLAAAEEEAKAARAERDGLEAKLARRTSAAPASRSDSPSATASGPPSGAS